MTEAGPSNSRYSRPLEKGKACLECRRRKVKCDGRRPLCQPCIRAGCQEDCEFEDDAGATKTQHLEESIAIVQARIQRLEVSSRASSSAGSRSSQASSPMPPSSPMTAASIDYRLSQLKLPHAWWTLDEPPFGVAKIIVDVLLARATQYSFFLHIPRFVDAVFPVRLLPGQHRPSPSLLSAVYLFGIHLSDSQILTKYEPNFLDRAINKSALALSTPHPRQAIHAIQAELLLSLYFLRTGNHLKAMQHLNNASSLSIGCGLHKLYSPGNFAPAHTLPPPVDSLEEGERIHAFWIVMAFQKAWGVALQWPSSISNVLDEQIETPWPKELSAYERRSSSPPVRSTLQQFLNEPTGGKLANTDSALTMRVKAAALFERATNLSAEWKPYLSSSDPLFQKIVALDRVITHFLDRIVSSDESPSSSDYSKNRLITYTLAQVAMIQLHRRIAGQDTRSAHKCLESANAAVRAIEHIPDISRWGYIDSIMSPLWALICQELICGIKISPRLSSPQSEYQRVLATFVRLTTIMSTFARNCPLMARQLTRVQESFAKQIT